MSPLAIYRDPTWYNIVDNISHIQSSLELTRETYGKGWMLKNQAHAESNSSSENDDTFHPEQDRESVEIAASLLPSQNTSLERQEETPVSSSPSDTDESSEHRRSNTATPLWDNYDEMPSYFGGQPTYFTTDPHSGPGFASLPHQHPNLLPVPPPLSRPLQEGRVYTLNSSLPLPQVPPRPGNRRGQSSTRGSSSRSVISRIRRWLR